MIYPDKLEYPKILEPLSRNKSSKIEVFTDFVRVSACALAAWAREEEYFAVQKTYKDEHMQLMSKAFASMVQEMEDKPFTDILWPNYTEVASGASIKQRGEFYTPDTICELMAKITMDTESIIENNQPITMSEPTCWSGGIILKVAQELAPTPERNKSFVDLLRVTASDINPVACDMTFINTTLWGIPARVEHANALSMESWNLWDNIHWKRVGENDRMMFKEIQRLLKENPNHTDKPTIPRPRDDAYDVTIPKKEGVDGQWEFEL